MRIAADGFPFILPPIFAAAVAVAAGQPAVALVLTALGAAVAAFFRDPERSSDAPGETVLSPADGRVIGVDRREDGSLQLAVFLSLFDVHVARAPIAGTATRCERIAGGYAAANRDAASENARVAIDIETPTGTARLALMAGLVARRVLPWITAPTTLQRGERIAIIRFGSRAELLLPPGYESLVLPGAVVRAGETPIAVHLS